MIIMMAAIIIMKSYLVDDISLVAVFGSDTGAIGKRRWSNDHPDGSYDELIITIILTIINDAAAISSISSTNLYSVGHWDFPHPKQVGHRSGSLQLPWPLTPGSKRQ